MRQSLLSWLLCSTRHEVSAESSRLSFPLRQGTTPRSAHATCLLDWRRFARLDSQVFVLGNFCCSGLRSTLLLELPGGLLGVEGFVDTEHVLLVVGGRLLFKAVHSEFVDLVVHHREVLSHSGQSGLVVVLEGRALGFFVVSRRHVHLGPL